MGILFIRSESALVITALIIGIILCLIREFGAIFANGNLDALLGKAFTERRALNDAGELLCRVDGKGVGEVDGEALALAARGAVCGDGGVCAIAGANVEEEELEAKGALCADAEVLQDKPEARLVLGVVEATGVDGVHANKVARVVGAHGSGGDHGGGGGGLAIRGGGGGGGVLLVRGRGRLGVGG